MINFDVFSGIAKKKNNVLNIRLLHPKDAGVAYQHDYMNVYMDLGVSNMRRADLLNQA